MKKRAKWRNAAYTPMSTPDSLKGKQFEDLCLVDAMWAKSRGHFSMGRYGVQVAFRKDSLGNTIPQAIHSLPDFEGVLPGGRQFITDAKVCSASSFPLHEQYLKKRQLSHMLERSKYGCICFVLVHFNLRELKTQLTPAQTYAMPVYEDHPFWSQVLAKEVKSLNRTHCDEYAVRVHWWLPKGCQKARPDVGRALAFLQKIPVPEGRIIK